MKFANNQNNRKRKTKHESRRGLFGRKDMVKAKEVRVDNGKVL